MIYQTATGMLTALRDAQRFTIANNFGYQSFKFAINSHSPRYKRQNIRHLDFAQCLIEAELECKRISHENAVLRIRQ